MPFCPNPDCDHRRRLGEPAEFKAGAKFCSDCGSGLTESAPHFETLREPEIRPQVSDAPDYTKYALEQLHDVYDHVDRERFPDRFNAIVQEIEKRESNPAPGKQPAAGKVIGWTCPQCGMTNHEDMVRCICGHDPQEKPARRRDLELRFHGSAREYFRVWIVNLCLTLLSSGFFPPGQRCARSATSTPTPRWTALRSSISASRSRSSRAA